MKGKAVIFTKIGEPLRIKEYDVVDPEPGDAMIKVELANICGSDLHIWRGDLDLAALGVPLPTILGHEMVGSVYKLGKGLLVDSRGLSLKEGDKVIYSYFRPCGHCYACVRERPAECINSLSHISISSDQRPHFIGAFAEYYYLHHGQIILKVPEGVKDELVAGINCAASQMMYALDEVGFKFGDNIVIQGAGGLGLYTTAILKERGANQIIIFDSNQARLQLASEFGADKIVNINEVNSPKDRVALVKELTNGWGADIVVEVAGFPQVIPEGIKMLGSGGKYLAIGNVSPGFTYQADPSELVLVNKRFYGVRMYDARSIFNALNFIIKNNKKYPFHKILATKFSLEDINNAFLEADKQNVYRAAIVP